MAVERVTLTDGTNTVDFLDGAGAASGYVKRNVQGLDPPPVKIAFAGDRPVHREYENREITITFSIKGSNVGDLEDKKHAILTILENTYLYWASRTNEGLKAQLEYRKEGAANISYIDVLSGECDWGNVEHQPGAPYAAILPGAQLVLTCEPCFHPSGVTNLVNASFGANHDDATADHDNFVDIAAANIKGDVEAKTKVTVKDHNIVGCKYVFLARRSAGTPGNLAHWLEAEDGTLTNLTDTADTDRSGAAVALNDGVATSGDTEHNLTANLGDHKGRFRVYVAAWADDIVNTEIRLMSRWGPWTEETTHTYKKLGTASQWQLIYLGTIWIPPENSAPNRIDLTVEYIKQANDTIKLDYLMLLPEDESALMLESAWFFSHDAATRNQVVIDGTADFPHAEIQPSATGAASGWALMRPGPLTLRPGKLNRIYVKVLKVSAGGDAFSTHTDYIDHNTSPTAGIYLTIDYLPQYLTPLN